MNKNIVMVAENPVKWKTLVRRHDKEPEYVSRMEAAPFYIEPGRENEGFSAEEREAILDSGKLNPGTVLVRQDRKDGRVAYVSVREDSDTLLSFFENERGVVHDLVANFLSLLGGRNVNVHTLSKQTRHKVQTEQYNVKAKGKSAAVKAGGQVDASSAESSNDETSLSVFSSSEKTDPAFGKAHEFLDRYPWMKEKFEEFLDSVENHRVHGKQSKQFKQEICKELCENYKCGMEVAVSYGLMDGTASGRFEKDFKERLHCVDEWEYSLELE